MTVPRGDVWILSQIKGVQMHGNALNKLKYCDVIPNTVRVGGEFLIYAKSVIRTFRSVFPLSMLLFVATIQSDVFNPSVLRLIGALCFFRFVWTVGNTQL